MKKFHTAVLGLAAGAVVALVATGADANGRRSIKDEPRAAPFSWTGLYIGISGGVAINSTEWTNGNPALDTGTFDDSGAIVGGTVGYNVQSGGFVFGVEGDWSWLNNEASTTAGGCSVANPCNTSVDWLATVRGRVGFLLGPSTLLYGTGGVAWAKLGHDFATSSISSTETGWVAGVGFETRLDANWSFKGEYLHVDLGDSLSCTQPTCPINVTAKDNQIDVLRAGLNYKF